MRRLPAEWTAVPFGPIAPPAPLTDALKAIDYQLQDMVLRVHSDGMPSVSQGQAQEREGSFQWLPNAYDKWVDIAKQGVLTVTGMELRCTGRGRQACPRRGRVVGRTLPVTMGWFHEPVQAVQVGCSTGAHVRNLLRAPVCVHKTYRI